jgi:transposase-like protein
MGTYGKDSRELKLRVVRLYAEEHESVKALSERFGLAKQTIYGWCKQYRTYGDTAFMGCGNRRGAELELQTLREENVRLKRENERLSGENRRLQKEIKKPPKSPPRKL